MREGLFATEPTDDEAEEADSRRAFNEGCDARLAGLLPKACPYPHGCANHNAWRQGWEHVHKTWGTGARWPFRRLPPLAVAVHQLD
jgi:hypothetical protein